LASAAIADPSRAGMGHISSGSALPEDRICAKLCGVKEGFFHRFAAATSRAVGSAYAFIASVALIAGWLVTGPVFHYSDTWQLIINTSTTIVTFLMVFLIQNTQNRDALAIHLKLDELIRATKRARNSMIDLTKLSDRQLKALEEHYRQICQGESPDDDEDARDDDDDDDDDAPPRGEGRPSIGRRA
jgi:low affinity Fe/Cu permease